MVGVFDFVGETSGVRVTVGVRVAVGVFVEVGVSVLEAVGVEGASVGPGTVTSIVILDRIVRAVIARIGLLLATVR
jgi:hypothetical protein